MKRHRLGTWRCPSGNSVDVFLTGRGRFRELKLEWDTFPLRAEDELYYKLVVLPAIARRVREYLEIVGPALVVTA